MGFDTVLLILKILSTHTHGMYLHTPACVSKEHICGSMERHPGLSDHQNQNVQFLPDRASVHLSTSICQKFLRMFVGNHYHQKRKGQARSKAGRQSNRHWSTVPVVCVQKTVAMGPQPGTPSRERGSGSVAQEGIISNTQETGVSGQLSAPHLCSPFWKATRKAWHKHFARTTQ